LIKLANTLAPAQKLDLLMLLLLLTALFLAWLVTPSKPLQPEFGQAPDFNAISDVSQMKMAFFDYLTPMIAYKNETIAADRNRLEGLAKKLQKSNSLTGSQLQWLADLGEEYQVDVRAQPGNVQQLRETIEQLLLRVDVVPTELALIQAAKESGWGRSRFSREINNYFGQWCYTPGCGAVPANRAPGASHEVQRFASVYQAVASYIHNLNTHQAYSPLRERRAQAHTDGQPADGILLAEGLVRYSERREAYVREVQSMIRQYRQLQDSRQQSTGL
jgi:Bax protein